MNKIQLLGIGAAVLSGAAAFYFMNQLDVGPAPIIQVMPRAELDKVLIAKNDLPYGLAISDVDTEWIDWPKASVPPGVVVKSGAPNAQEEIRNALVLAPITKGDPLRMERIAKGVSAGVMATMLPSGKRAVAVDVSLNSTAGGFILPNDRVDVMRVFRDPDSSGRRDARRSLPSWCFRICESSQWAKQSKKRTMRPSLQGRQQLLKSIRGKRKRCSSHSGPVS
jgi:pilus assembly protein CpaB